MVNGERYVYDSSASVPMYKAANDRSKIDCWYSNAYVYLPLNTMKTGKIHLEKQAIANSEERHKTTNAGYKVVLNKVNDTIRAYLSS